MSLGLLEALLIAAETTLIVAAGAWCVAALVGLLLAALQTTGIRAAVLGSQIVITLFRGVPQLLVLYLIYFGIGEYGVNVSPLLAAIVGLGLTEAGNTAEYYRAGFLTVPESQRHAGLSIGLTHRRTTWHVVIPQTIPYLVPPLLNTFVGLLKLATLASAVGAPEILYRAQVIMNQYGDVGTVALVVIAIYVIVTMPLLRLTKVLEQRLRLRYG